jgi:hypothetical protein
MADDQIGSNANTALKGRRRRFAMVAIWIMAARI